MNQDPATGRFLPGNKASKGGGRPSTEAAEKLRAALEGVVDNGTMPKWRAAMKRKLEHGDQWATQFVFERIAGKVPDVVATADLDDAGKAWLLSMLGADDSTMADSGAETPGPGTARD